MPATNICLNCASPIATSAQFCSFDCEQDYDRGCEELEFIRSNDYPRGWECLDCEIVSGECYW